MQTRGPPVVAMRRGVRGGGGRRRRRPGVCPPALMNRPRRSPSISVYGVGLPERVLISPPGVRSVYHRDGTHKCLTSRSKRVSFHAVTGPSRRSRGLPVVLSHCITLIDGAVPNSVHSPDSPTSPPLRSTIISTTVISTEMVAPAGLEPARIRPHRAAPSCRRTPTLTERNGTTQPPATCVPHHRLHSAERNAISQRLRPTDAVLTGRRPTSPALTRDSHPLGTRICCARLCPFDGRSTRCLKSRASLPFSFTGRCAGATPRRRSR